MFTPESPIIAPVAPEVAAALSNNPHEIYGDHAPAPRETYDFERTRRAGPRGRSHISVPHEVHGARNTLNGDRGLTQEVSVSGPYEHFGEEMNESQSERWDGFARVKDDYFTPSERRAFDESVGDDKRDGLISRADVKRVAQLRREGTITDGPSIASLESLVDNASKDNPVARVILFGAGVTAWAYLHKRRRSALATTALLFGLLQGADGCVKPPSTPEAVASNPFQTQTIGDVEATFLDNYPVKSTSPRESIRPLMDISTEQAPNFRVLSDAMLTVLKRSEYRQLEITSLSYEHLPAGLDGKGDLERLVAATRQTAPLREEPLFIVANMSPNGGVDVTTVVRRKSDRAQLTFSDGTTRAVWVTDVYRFVESDGRGGYVLGDFMQAVYRDPATGQEYVIVYDPEDGEKLVFVPKDGVNPDDVVGGDSSGTFGPKLALLMPVPTIPAPAEVLVTRTPTPEPTEVLPSATPLPMETATVAPTEGALDASVISGCTDQQTAQRKLDAFKANHNLEQVLSYIPKVGRTIGGTPPGESKPQWISFNYNVVPIAFEAIDLQGIDIAGLTAGPNSSAVCVWVVSPEIDNEAVAVLGGLTINGVQIEPLLINNAIVSQDDLVTKMQSSIGKVLNFHVIAGMDKVGVPPSSQAPYSKVSKDWFINFQNSLGNVKDTADSTATPGTPLAEFLAGRRPEGRGIVLLREIYDN